MPSFQFQIIWIGIEWARGQFYSVRKFATSPYFATSRSDTLVWYCPVFQLGARWFTAIKLILILLSNTFSHLIDWFSQVRITYFLNGEFLWYRADATSPRSLYDGPFGSGTHRPCTPPYPQCPPLPVPPSPYPQPLFCLFPLAILDLPHCLHNRHDR